MDGYKHIEHCCGSYIASHYRNPVEIGVGNNPDAARCMHEAGVRVRATDIRACDVPPWLPFSRDDIFSPDLSCYAGADVLYAVRPAVEMIPPMIALAKRSTATWWFAISVLNPTGTAGQSSTAACRSTVITGRVRTRQRAWTDFWRPFSCRARPGPAVARRMSSSGGFTVLVSGGSGPRGHGRIPLPGGSIRFGFPAFFLLLQFLIAFRFCYCPDDLLRPGPVV